jgi:predicted GIY-YIG superfamily endonuclease
MLAEINSSSPFDSIRHVDDAGNEYWSARELMPLLGYRSYYSFVAAIDRAKISILQTGKCDEFNIIPIAHEIIRAQGGGSNRSDYRLSRYACYLVAMNGDIRKPEITAAQCYFAIKLTAYDYLLQSGFGIKSDVFDFNNFGSQASVDKSGFVYLIESEGTNFFKIGYSKKLLTRLKNIQVGNPFQVTLVHRIFTLNAIELERALHDYYVNHLVKGEWYEMTSSMVKDFPSIAADLDMRIEYDVFKLERILLTEKS